MVSLVETATTRVFPGGPRRLWRQMVYTDIPVVVGVWVLLLALTLAAWMRPVEVPFLVLLVPMVLGSLWLGPRALPWLVTATLLVLVVLLPRQEDLGPAPVVRFLVVCFVGVVILLTSMRRARLGVSGPRGESMLADLRDRLVSQGEMPELPAHWYARSAQRAAGGAQFAGDFVVTAPGVSGRSLEVVVVDVSGKGVGAGPRSLLLSGAFGGLLSGLAPSEFLTGANRYLLRQGWAEGFATAIHLHLDLDTGDYELRKAGHPPAIQLHAGSGGWSVLESDGPALGLLEVQEFECLRGTLRPGDGLLLYTDGMVENPARDISSGIDKLAGAAGRFVKGGFEGAESQLVRQVGRADDDRALVLVHRRWVAVPSR